MPLAPDPSPSAAAACPPAPAYRVRLASSAHDIRAAQALRYAVFNLELGEGLAASHDAGLDADAFDAQCAHLLVEVVASGDIVGTYRMQTGPQARQGIGYYSAREFDFGPYEPMRAQVLELGRACIHRQHRNLAVLNLLWAGIARHAQQHGARLLLGCSSLTSQDPAEAAAAWQQLQPHLAPPALRTRPWPAFACPVVAPGTVRLPRLLGTYLALGAVICGPPAIDRAFRTIDFLTLLDLQSPAFQALRLRGHFGAAP